MTDEPKPGGLVAELKAKAAFYETFPIAEGSIRDTFPAQAFRDAADIAAEYEARWQAREAELLHQQESLYLSLARRDYDIQAWKERALRAEQAQTAECDLRQAQQEQLRVLVRQWVRLAKGGGTNEYRQIYETYRECIADLLKILDS